jgi:hypothetical protein
MYRLVEDMQVQLTHLTIRLPWDRMPIIAIPRPETVQQHLHVKQIMLHDCSKFDSVLTLVLALLTTIAERIIARSRSNMLLFTMIAATPQEHTHGLGITATVNVCTLFLAAAGNL